MSNQDSLSADKFAANLRAIAADEDCPTVLEPFAIEAADRIESLTRELAQAKERLKQRKCAANMYSDPPQDCDAPYCGCNPAWSECIEMLQEHGWKSPDELRPAQPSIESQAEPSLTYSRACQLLADYYVALFDRECCGDEFQAAYMRALTACTDAMGVKPPASPQSEPAQPSIESQAQMLERALQTVMARLADLLDEDQFKQIEAIVLKAGVPPPQSEPQEAMRGFCGLHLWGAPEGKDDMPCPYCTGELRSRLG